MAERFVLDTTILVEYDHGVPEVSSFLRPLTQRGLVVLHPVAVYEFLRGL